MTLEKIETESISIISDVLETAGRPAAAFGGGKESVVLLHLLRRCGGGVLPVPAITLDPPKGYTRLYYFMDKLGRLWGFRPVRPKDRPGDAAEGGRGCGSLYAGLERLAGASAGEGVTHLFTGLRKEEEGVGDGLDLKMPCGGITLVNPLAGFTEEDVWGYIKKHRVPYCSLYDASFKKLDCLTGRNAVVKGGRVREASVEEEEEEIKSRLKRLGYL